MKIILHVNEVERFSMAINNIRNLLALDSHIKIELLIHGPAIRLMLKEQLIQNNQMELFDALYSQGVVFAACNNTMKQMNICQTDIYQNTIIVPAGVYELAQKQQQGYCYIKP